MVSAKSLCKEVVNVKGMAVDDASFYTDYKGVKHLQIKVHPHKRQANRCPICNKVCPGYDQPTKTPQVWRDLDWGGIMVELVSHTHRVECREHGRRVAMVPWAYPDSRFTKRFDLEAAWLATNLSKSAVADFLRVDWATVGNCIDRAMKDIEPDRSRRLDNLVRIGIDETSYKKGHKYITVVVNHDTNTVVWAAEGHGKKVLTSFYQSLTPEQLASIKVVTGDGAGWITDCVNEFTPGCERCVDPFHVVEWAMEALDEVRREAWRKAYDEARHLSEGLPKRRGRKSKDDVASAIAKAAEEKAAEIKNSSYALGKAPEHLTENQQVRLEMIANTDNRLYRAYMMKEELRLLLKIKNTQEAEAALKRWLWWASHSRIPAFKELYAKIKRHKDHILNTIRIGMSNARIEATNNKIKLIIRKSYGFRNIHNMLEMVYLVCSDLKVPLPNR